MRKGKYEGKETEEYAKEVVTAYTEIGQMHNSYLSRNAKEEIRDEKMREIK